MTKNVFFKQFKSVVLMSLVGALLISCAPKLDSVDYTSNQSNVKPNMTPKQDGFDFIALHNYVIDGLIDEDTPFFYITDGSVDISGDNQKKVIVLKCTAMDRTTVHDLDLFLSMAIRLIGQGCAEQNFKYTMPTIDKYQNYTYTDFGSVFNTYSLSLDCKKVNGEVLRNDYIKAGSPIPIDPRYWSE